MGGRGSKSASSKKSAASASKPMTAAQAQAATSDAAVSADTSAGGAGLGGEHTLDEIRAMTDAELDAYLKQLDGVDMPNFLNTGSRAQKFIYDCGINDKPQVVDAATFDAMGGTELFRTVNKSYDSKNDVGMTADQIAQQTMGASLCRIGDGVYGDGLYFAESKSDSAQYGTKHGVVKSTAQIRAKLSPNAKVIDFGKLHKMYSSEAYKKPPTAASKMDIASYALLKGYNVISVGNKPGYHNVLDRSALVICNEINPI